MPGDPFWANVSFLSGFEDATPSDYTEQSSLAQTASFADDGPAFRLGISKHGNYSYQLDTIGGFNVPYNAAFLSGTTPFTVEFWAYLRSSPSTGTRDVCGQWGESVGAWRIVCNTTTTLVKYFQLLVSTDGGTGTDATVFSAGALDIALQTWFYTTIDFDGAHYRLFVDGVMVEKITAAHSIFASTLPLFFGGRTNGGNVSAWGSAAPLMIDDPRVTVGSSRYGSDTSFTPPTAPHPLGVSDPNWDDVVFVWDFETTIFNDESNLAAVGGQGVFCNVLSGSAAQSKFGTQSLFLEGPVDAPAGRGGCGIVPHNTAFDFGTGSWTVEGWYRFDADAISTTGWCYLAACINRSSGKLGWAIDTYDIGDGTWRIGYEGNGVGTSYGTGFSPWVANTWYHIAADYDGTSYRFYRNGVMIQKNTGYVTTSSAAPAPLTIGGLAINFLVGGPNTNEAQSFSGHIDKFRVTKGVARYANDGGFAVPTAAFERGEVVIDPPDRVITESVLIGDASDSINFLLQIVGETINISEPVQAVKPFSRDIALSMVLSDAELAVARAYLRALTDSVDLADTTAAMWGVLVRDAIITSGLARGNATYQVATVQSLAMQELLRTGMPAQIAEEVVALATAEGLQAVQLLETLRITPQVLGSALYGRSLVESLRIVDALARFLDGSVLEGVEFADPVVSTLRAHSTVAEGVDLTAAEQPLWVLRAVAEDTVELTAAQAINMLFNPEVEEEIELAGGYFGPDGSFTTWAMNTRTGAVTEYDNYAFNSFAKVGNKYVGAAETGLYELLGDDDDGQDIIARIKSGFMQFGSTRLSRLKAAYIAARSEGEFILKVETGDGAIYNYAVSTRNMRSTKVHMGKGQRARYFAFELISTDGHDFDLDTLEFVPIVVQRRV